MTEVDYTSPQFEAGMADGWAGRPCAQPTDASYYEGWLMGDAERYCARHDLLSEWRTRVKNIIRQKLADNGVPQDRLDAATERRFDAVMGLQVPSDAVLRELERALAGEFEAIEVNADTPDDLLDEFLFGPWPVP